MTMWLRIVTGLAVVVVVGIIISTFTAPPVATVQNGFRGTGMEMVYNPAAVRAQEANNVIPASLPPLPAAGPKAGQVYKNVQILGDLSVGEFTRLMASITTWVAPQAGCTYCHNPENMAEDSKYTKVVARRMIQMVQHINADWTTHVAQTGVTCYTCHRGLEQPANIWFNNPGPEEAGGFAETNTGKNLASPAVGDTSLPYDPFTPFLEQSDQIRVQGTTALPDGNRNSIKQTEWTYALMVHFATALGVNCDYCHNTRSFSSWEQSTPQRATAWYGIRMVRDLNDSYLDPLRSVFPHEQLGPLGDSPKVNCATCHQGAYKPLYGVSMVQTFPELRGPTQQAAAK